MQIKTFNNKNVDQQIFLTIILLVYHAVGQKCTPGGCEETIGGKPCNAVICVFDSSTNTYKPNQNGRNLAACRGTGKVFNQKSHFCFEDEQHVEIVDRFAKNEIRCHDRNRYENTQYECCTADDQVYGTRYKKQSNFRCNRDGSYTESVNGIIGHTGLTIVNEHSDHRTSNTYPRLEKCQNTIYKTPSTGLFDVNITVLYGKIRVVKTKRNGKFLVSFKHLMVTHSEGEKSKRKIRKRKILPNCADDLINGDWITIITRKPFGKNWSNSQNTRIYFHAHDYS